jgi:hypothetical protein
MRACFTNMLKHSVFRGEAFTSSPFVIGMSDRRGSHNVKDLPPSNAELYLQRFGGSLCFHLQVK